MKEKEKKTITKVPTLLELAQMVEKKPAPPPSLAPSSDESDYDQPPVKGSYGLGDELHTALLKPSLLTQRKSPREKNSSMCSQQSSTSEETSKSESFSDEELQERLLEVPYATSESGKMKPSKKKSAVSIDNSNLPELPQTSQNYQIKEIRKGIPEIMISPSSANVNFHVSKFYITSYCVCRPKSNKRRSPVAWIFSLVTFLICVVLPLVSFGADVGFFIVCSKHYNETKQLLEYARENVVVSSAATYLNNGQNLSYPQIHLSLQDASLPMQNHRNESSAPHPKLPQFQNKTQSLKQIVRHGEKDQFVTNSEVSVPQTLSTPTSHNFYENNLYTNLIESATSAHCHAEIQLPVCNTIPNLLRYMTTDEAKNQLERHRRITADVFEPVFILGSFPCLITSIFSRLVIMVSKHDHFLSAYAMYLLTMPLQLVTGGLAVHSAAYHVGQNGFACWKCAMEEDCSHVEALSFAEDGVIVNLIIATIAKVFDGVAGGCVLYAVLARVIWITEGHVSCWWYFCRFWLSLASLFFCVIVSTTMVLTPTVGVFRLQMMEKTAYFHGKNGICYGSMTLLAMGLTAWTISILFFLFYGSFKTYVYCRRKEHIVGGQVV